MLSAVDARRYPKAAEYLSRLPDGLDSHPQCQVKGSILASMLGSTPVPFVREGLPAPLVALLDEPPLPNAWVSEVSFNALLMAHEEQLAPDVLSAWVEARNRRLMRSPLYAVLFRLVGPERILSGSANRWRAFRRGTELRVVAQAKGSATVQIDSPFRLYTASIVDNITKAWGAACEVAGARNFVGEVETLTDVSACCRARWD
jgi:hypothetical protein